MKFLFRLSILWNLIHRLAKWFIPTFQFSWKKNKKILYIIFQLFWFQHEQEPVYFFFYSISSTELRWVVVLREDEAQLVVICVLYTFWREAEREVSHFNTVSYIKIYFSVYMLLHLWKWAKVQNWRGAVLYTRTTGGTDAEPQRRFCSSVKHEDEDCSQWDFSRALTENLTGLEFEICSVQNLICWIH